MSNLQRNPPLAGNRLFTLPSRSACRGFSLLELAVVLVVIALIMAAVSVGGTVYRHAMMTKSYSDFVLEWQRAYSSYMFVSRGMLPADDEKNPAYAISGAVGTMLCGADLAREFLRRGVEIPGGSGLAERSTRYAYSDRSDPHMS
ncbi:prepilin-type N-terminal cleavage/methylation domain-containing protein [Piscinibacter aquaticus]|uniref:Prepilin-type N-terminal cleavage/methylation domain-containing protein n=1 Tax=Piscinibacter aquaticus TaxID=392597 RepID=A0A5C6TNQ2_9BURK|nr:prepilin-type N-terminal cleavage/methylation domain-containing protein [Piscinibacter aquaticus]